MSAANQVVRRPLTSRDLLALKEALDPQISPDGRWVVWVLKAIDAERNTYRTTLQLTNAEDGTTRQITAGPRDAAPRWSPDGRWIAFLSQRDELPGNQLYLLPVAGGEARPLTRLRHGAGPALWSPDGQRIAFVVSILPDRGLEDVDAEDPDDLYSRYNRDVKVITRLPYKMDGDHFLGAFRSQLALIDIDPTSNEIPVPRLLTNGLVEAGDPAWSPDGREIAFTRSLDPSGDLIELGSALYALAPDTGAVREIARLVGGLDRPAWSPDGRALAVLGQVERFGSASDDRLWLVDATHGRPECLTERFERSVGGSPVWSEDGESIYVSAGDQGSIHLFRASVERREVEPLTEGNLGVTRYSFSRDRRRAALLISTVTEGSDVFVTEAGTAGLSEPRRLTAINADLLSELEITAPEKFQFQSDGVTIDGWLMRPAGFDPAKRYPAVLVIHGGPAGMYGWHEFDLDFHALAAAGYVVLYTNPRGSSGYGQEFSLPVRGKWGTVDQTDIVNGLRHALAAYDFIDGERLGVTGVSYGGYMTNWLISQEPDLFKAAIPDRSISNTYSEFLNNDIDYYLWRGNHGGAPWEVPNAYFRESPICFAANVKTPTLIIHMEEDHACPMEQGEQFYRALKLLGVPVELVLFPGESHGFDETGTPWHRVYRLDKIVKWFGRWL